MKFLYKKTFFIFPFLTSIYLQAQEKPNLVSIMADQWRGDALGCLGKEPVKTPCLDQLAREGVNFTNAVSSYPVSSPARGMLMTGMYPHKNKVTGNCNSANAPYGVDFHKMHAAGVIYLKPMDTKQDISANGIWMLLMNHT